MAQKKPLAFAMVDLDNFKQLNDQYGHQMGDQCLHEFAKLLEAAVGSLGYIYRYGGDEFSLLFVDLELSVVESLLDDIIRKSRGFYSVGEVLNITASIGAVFLEAGKVGPQNLNTFINYADNALYIAKNEGKNLYKKVVI
jgi:diguanylate cyclase (GGDEF)-like protein